MASHSWAEKVLLGKTDRSPRGLVEDSDVICASTPGVAERYGISKTATQLREMVFRHWFKCPLCGRRSFKLYLPPGGTVFGCRDCHHLTYTSSLKRNPDGSPRRRVSLKPYVAPQNKELVTVSTWASLPESAKWLPHPTLPYPETLEDAKWLPRSRAPKPETPHD